MSGKQRSRKTMRVSIPGVNMSILRGDGKMDEPRSALDKRRESIEEIDLQGEELDAEARLIRRRRTVEQLSRGDEAPPQEKGSDLGDTLVEKLVIPLLSERLQGNNQRGQGDPVTLRALKMLEDERSRAGRGDPKTSTSVLDDIPKAINLVKEIRDLTSDPQLSARLDKIEAALKDAPEKKGAIDQVQDTLALLETVKSSFNLTGAGGNGDSAALIAHERWKIGYESTEKTRDRAWNLRLRQIDKKHDLDMAKLNIASERNELLDHGIKRVGEVFVEALFDDEDLDEGLKGKKIEGSEIMEIQCPTEDCDTLLSIPPEGQAPGATIRCPVCKGKFETYEKD